MLKSVDLVKGSTNDDRFPFMHEKVYLAKYLDKYIPRVIFSMIAQLYNTKADDMMPTINPEISYTILTYNICLQGLIMERGICQMILEAIPP